MTGTSGRYELVRLAREQALLSRDLSNLNADLRRDLLALRKLPTDMTPHTDWHAEGTTLINKHSRPRAANGLGGQHTRTNESK